ncbi:hypothetical protein [Pectobacterium brasiliense]|uniref:hypothetical protein n=1 Tax=Pectobacterium brasiliense TaxID=180957 RepID=UPI00300DC060
MKIDGIGHVPQGEPKQIVVGLCDTLNGPENYIDVIFDLGVKTQKHFGKVIEDILYNPEYMARELHAFSF